MGEKIEVTVEENPKDFDISRLKFPRSKFDLISVDRVERYKRGYEKQISGDGKKATYYVQCETVWVTLKCKRCGTVKQVKDGLHIGCKEGPCNTWWKDLTGKKIGKLTILEYVYAPYRSNGKKDWYWKCRCECGNICLKEAHALLNTGTKECPSCANKRRACSLLKENGGAAWNSAYRITHNNAVKRGYEFNLTMDEFKAISMQPCFYCGSAPSIALRAGKRQHILVGYRSGIDRRDNNKGYIPGNCVPCCYTCNSMKTDHTYEDWIAHMEKILKHCKERSTTIPKGSTSKRMEKDSGSEIVELF